MTVSSEIKRADYTGNGSTTAFATQFRFLQNSDVKVILTVTATGVETDQAETTNYTLVGAGLDAGGTVTMLIDPAIGETLTIKRDVPLTQGTDYVENDNFPAESHEDALDKLTMITQQMQEELDRSLKLSESQISSGLTLPIPDTGKLLRWDVNDDLENVTEVQLGTVNKDELLKIFDTSIDAIGSGIIAIGDVVLTGGRRTKGDAGDNLYEVVAAGTGTVDGGSFINTTGIAGQLKGLFPKGRVTVTQFDAVKGAIIDSLTNFQAAIDFQEKEGRVGGIVFVPKGSYLLDGTLRIGGWTTLKGEGSFSSSLVFPSTFTLGNCIELGPDASGEFSYSGSHGFGMRLEDLDINASGIFRGLDRAVIFTVGAHQPSGVVRCNLRNVISIGIHYDVGTGGPANFNIEDVNIQGTTTAPTTGDKIGIKASAGGAVITCNRVQVETDDTVPFDVGIDMLKDRLMSIDCHFEGCSKGILLRQNETTPAGNTIIEAGGGPGTPILIERALTNNTEFVAINAKNFSLVTPNLKVINDLAKSYFVEDQVVPFYRSNDRAQTILGAALTIATGVITITAPVVSGYHTVDTEAAGASDDLDTISPSTGAFDDGVRITVRPFSSVRTVVIKNGTGNIFTKTGADVTLDTREKTITLMFDAQITSFVEV